MGNSLAAVHPELIAEWSEKNLPLTPDSITFGSNKKVWWKGACGHEWETSVRSLPKLWRLQTARLGGSAEPAIMNGIRLSLHAQAAVNVLVAVDIYL